MWALTVSQIRRWICFHQEHLMKLISGRREAHSVTVSVSSWPGGSWWSPSEPIGRWRWPQPSRQAQSAMRLVRALSVPPHPIFLTCCHLVGICWLCVLLEVIAQALDSRWGLAAQGNLLERSHGTRGFVMWFFVRVRQTVSFDLGPHRMLEATAFYHYLQAERPFQRPLLHIEGTPISPFPSWPVRRGHWDSFFASSWPPTEAKKVLKAMKAAKNKENLVTEDAIWLRVLNRVPLSQHQLSLPFNNISYLNIYFCNIACAI